MDRETLLSDIANNEALKRYARKTTSNNDLWQDIIAELLIQLCEMPHEKLKSIFESQGIYSYCYKVIHLSWNSPNSPFYRKYVTERIEDIPEPIDYDFDIDICYNKVTGAIEFITKDIEKTRFPTEAKIFDIFLECGSFRKTANKLNLPVMTIHKIITGFKEKVKELI
jgi:hypothetical protein